MATITAEDRTHLLFENCKKKKAKRRLRHRAANSNKTALHSREAPA